MSDRHPNEPSGADRHLEEALEERFDRLKAEERASVPDFAQMYARAQAEAAAMADATDVVPLASRRRRSVQHPWRWALGSLAAAALAGVMLIAPGDPTESADAEFEELVNSFAEQAGDWESPTDGLLDVPGSQLMKSIPVIGGPYGTPLDATGGSSPDGDVTG